MKRLLLLIIAALVVGLVGSSIAFGQEDEEVTTEDVEAAFIDLTRADVEAMGYAVEEDCITAEAVGAPAALGAMGFHAVNEDLIDDVINPLEPEAVLLDADDNVIAVEYIGNPNSGLSVFGEDLVFVEPIGHDALHVWFLENPSGQFADFNPNASCPVVVDQLASTGTGGYLASDGGNGALTWLIALAAIASAAMVAGGWTLRRKTS